MHSNPKIATLLTELLDSSLRGIDFSLARITRLLAAMGNPQDNLPPVIHIAGTNGKGSTQAFLRAIYQAAGYRVHACTSPHLVRFNERIIINNAEISDEALEEYLARVNAMVREIPVTYFEAVTALAFVAFATHPADVVLLETGCGGRLDATNMVRAPVMTVITPIDLDHMEFLGDTIEKIAAEKAGIIKPQVPCILGAQSEAARKVLARAAYQQKAPLVAHGVGWDYGMQGDVLHVSQGLMSWRLPRPSLPGAHQFHNAALASVVARNCAALPVTDEALQAGIRWAVWPGRLQHLTRGPLVDAWGGRGDVYLDGGHNPHAARALAAWVDAQPRPVTMVCGMMARKDAVAFFAPVVGKLAQLITITVPGHESYSAEELAAKAREAGMVDVRACSLDDLPARFSGDAQEGTLLIAGSLFLVGELLKNHG